MSCTYAYSFTSTVHICNSIMHGYNPNDVWDRIKHPTDTRFSKLLTIYEDKSDILGVAYFHYFKDHDICCIEYVNAKDAETAQKLITEVARRVYLHTYSADTCYLRVRSSEQEDYTPDASILMGELFVAPHVMFSANYKRVHAQRIMQALYCMFKYAWGFEDPWECYEFKKGIEDLILGPAYLTREIN